MFLSTVKMTSSHDQLVFYNPLHPSVKIQVSIHNLNYGTNWENLLKIIAISLTMTWILSLDYVLKLYKG